MLSRLSRPAALILAPALALSLAACGGSPSEGSTGLDAVSISGEPGQTPTFDWKDTLVSADPTSKVLSKGDGPAIDDGDVVIVNYTIANGFTHTIDYNTYDKTTVASLVKVGAEAKPRTVTDLLVKAVADAIEPGQTIGSRIAVTIGSDKLLGDYAGNSQVQQFMTQQGIGNEDGLVFVADLTGLAEPQGTQQKAPAWAPRIVTKDGVPASLDFKGTPAPSGDLEVATLTKGDGPVVKSGQTVLVNYLGQVYDGAKPFDESYSAGTGFQAVIGGDQASVVKGWSQGLVGLPVGSRVLLQIPPALGYGDKPQGNDIPANSTLYFVVDILDAAATPPPPPTATPPASPSEAPASPSGKGKKSPSGNASQ